MTSNRFLPADKDRPLGENAAVRSVVQKEGVPGEVSAYSTVFPEQAPLIGWGWRRCPIRSCLKFALGSMHCWFRKAYCLPLSPRVTARRVLLSLLVQLQFAASEHRDARAAMPRTSVSSRQPACRLRVPCCCRGRCPISSRPERANIARYA